MTKLQDEGGNIFTQDMLPVVICCLRVGHNNLDLLNHSYRVHHMQPLLNQHSVAKSELA